MGCSSRVDWTGRAVAARDPAPLPQSQFRDLRQRSGLPGTLGPERRGFVAVRRLAGEQHHSPGHPVDHLALQRKPSASHLGGAAGVGEPFPKSGFEGSNRCRSRRGAIRLSGIALDFVEVRRTAYFGSAGIVRGTTALRISIQSVLPLDFERSVPGLILA
jgi:hypothetical protein